MVLDNIVTNNLGNCRSPVENKILLKKENGYMWHNLHNCYSSHTQQHKSDRHTKSKSGTGVTLRLFWLGSLFLHLSNTHLKDKNNANIEKLYNKCLAPWLFFKYPIKLISNSKSSIITNFPIRQCKLSSSGSFSGDSSEDAVTHAGRVESTD